MFLEIIIIRIRQFHSPALFTSVGVSRVSFLVREWKLRGALKEVAKKNHVRLEGTNGFPVLTSMCRVVRILNGYFRHNQDRHLCSSEVTL